MKHRSQILFLTICMLTVGLMALPAHADTTYHYTFVGTDTAGDTVGFQYTTSSLINTLTALDAAQLDYCNNCQAGTGDIVALAPLVPGYGDAVELIDANSNVNFYIFNPGALSTLGSYGTDWANNGSLTVAVPEPASAGLTLAGGVMLAGLAFFRRKPVAGNLIA